MENEIWDVLLRGFKEMIGYTNGLYLILFFIVGWIILYGKNKKRTNKDIIILSIVGVIIGGIFHWLFDLYSKIEIFTTLVTYLLGLLIFRLDLDLKFLKMFKRNK